MLTRLLDSKRVAMRIEAQRARSLQQRRSQPVVAFQYGASHAGLSVRGNHRIGELIRMEDGSPPGRSAHHLPAVRTQAVEVNIGKGLRMPQRKTGRLPRIQANGRDRLAASNVLEDRFIRG